MTYTAIAFSNSHLMMVAAAILLVVSIIWYAAVKSRTGKRNLVTGTLLTLIGIGVYPVIFQKNSSHDDKDIGEIEKTGDTILVCKITPMRNENGESTTRSASSEDDTASQLEQSPESSEDFSYLASTPSVEDLATELPNYPASDRVISSHKLLAQQRSVTKFSQLAVALELIEKRTISAVMALKSAEHS